MTPDLPSSEVHFTPPVFLDGKRFILVRDLPRPGQSGLDLRIEMYELDRMNATKEVRTLQIFLLPPIEEHGDIDAVDCVSRATYVHLRNRLRTPTVRLIHADEESLCQITVMLADEFT